MPYPCTLGAPSDPSDRSDTELRVYSLLDRLGIVYARVDHPAAATMEDCLEVDRALFPAVMCKNLLLCNSQKTDFYLLMIPGNKKFKTKEISHQLGISRLSFAGEEPMKEYLDILPGSLSVLGLMNDRENRVRLLVDREVLAEEMIGCHPCVNTSSLRLSAHDIFKVFLPAVGHDFTPVTLLGEE